MMEEQGLPVKQLPSTLELLKESIREYRKHPTLYLSLHVLFYVPNSLLQLSGTLDQLNLLTPTEALIYSLVLLVVAIITLPMMSIGMIYAMHRPVKPTLGEALREGLRCYLPYTMTTILYLMILWSGLILLVVPAMLFSFWFYLFPYIVVVERKKWLTALVTSKAYMKGNILKVLGRTILLSCITTPLALILVGIFYLITGDLPTAMTLYAFFIIPIMPVFTIFSYLLYKHLRSMTGEINVNVTKRQRIGYSALAGVGPFVTLVYVLLIAGILFQAIMTSYKDPGERDAQRIKDIRSIDRALTDYRVDKGQFPRGLSELVPGYIDELPEDPRSSSLDEIFWYEYSPDQNGKDYRLCVRFEQYDPERQCISLFYRVLPLPTSEGQNQ